MTQFNANGKYWASDSVYTPKISEYTTGGGVTFSGTGTISIPSSGLTFAGTNQTALADSGRGSFNVILAGIWAANQTVAVTWVKRGGRVTLTFPAVSVTQNAADVVNSTADNGVPSYLRPTIDVSFSVMIRDSTVQAATGRLKIYTDGAIEIDKTNAGGAFSGSGNGGWEATAVTYICT